MSPARARTSYDDIVAAGREILEAGGLDAVTMLAVAERVGVRAPSLYKRFADRGALIAAIGAASLKDLPTSSSPSPGIRIRRPVFSGSRTPFERSRSATRARTSSSS